MAIRINDDILFVHVPRTAGSFLTNLLDERYRTSRLTRRNSDGYGGHSVIAHYGELERYKFIFAFVRHPLTWAESSWRLLQARGRPWKPFKNNRRRWRGNRPGRYWWHPWDKLLECKAETFHDWIHNICRNEPGLFTRMAEWFVGPENSGICDFIGRYENLYDDIHEALTRAGLPDVPSPQEIREMPIYGKRTIAKPSRRIKWQTDTMVRFEESERVLIRRFWPASMMPYGRTTNRTEEEDGGQAT